MLRIILLVLVAGTIAGAGYYFGGMDFSSKKTTTDAVDKTQSEKAPSVVVENDDNWLTYRDPVDNFEINYPSNWGVVSLSGSTVVAPKNRIEKIVQLKELGNFGGGIDLTMQIFVEDGSGNTEVYPSTSRDMVKKSVTLGSLPVTEYQLTWKESLPGGLEAGTKTIAYVINFGSKQVRVDLLDLQHEAIMKKIVATLTFPKTAKLTVGQLSGKTLNEVATSWGVPNLQKVNIEKKREVWVYTRSGDSTATYVYFENGKVTSTRTDEFNGDLSSESFLK